MNKNIYETISSSWSLLRISGTPKSTVLLEACLIISPFPRLHGLYDSSCHHFYYSSLEKKYLTKVFYASCFQHLFQPMKILELLYHPIELFLFLFGLIPRQRMRKIDFWSFDRMFGEHKFWILSKFYVMLDISLALINNT